MTRETESPSTNRIHNRRRQFFTTLAGIGLLGTAGCTGILDDENGDDDPADADDGDDSAPGDDADDEPAGDEQFGVSNLDPSDITIEEGETFTVSATIVNTSSYEGTQDIELRIDGSVFDSEEMMLERISEQAVTFEDVEPTNLEPAEYEFGVYSEDDDATGTLTIEAGMLLSVITGEASGPMTSIATLNGELEMDPSDSVDVWFEWGEAGDDLDQSTERESMFGGGSFSASVRDLALDTTYEFRAMAEYEDTVAEGDVEEFTTVEEVGDIPDTVIHRWPMEEGDGDTVADVISGEDGTIEGDVEWVDNDWHEGHALQNNSDGTVQLTDLGEFGDDLNQDFALAYTIESNDDRANGGVLSARGGDVDGISVYYNSGFFGISQSPGMTISDGDVESAIKAVEDGLLVGGPHRVVLNKITNDSENWEIFVDGLEIDTELGEGRNDLGQAPPLPTNARLFEDDLQDDRPLEAVLDDVIIFGEALSEGEAGADYERQPWS